jgi:hypothetical protein
MTTPTELQTVTTDAMKASWYSQARIVVASYSPNTTLRRKDAAALVEALSGWIGSSREPFALLGDVSGLRGADPDYRAITTKFYKQHEAELRIALFNVGPLLRTMVEMFRVSSGVQLKAFANEAQAREWLRQKGIAA